jgi:hypothetical protein
MDKFAGSKIEMSNAETLRIAQREPTESTSLFNLFHHVGQVA